MVLLIQQLQENAVNPKADNKASLPKDVRITRCNDKTGEFDSFATRETSDIT
jgi:hypothetical protein